MEADGEIVHRLGLPPDWELIATDVLRTTGRRLSLRDAPDYGDGVVEAALDGRWDAGFSFAWSSHEQGLALAMLVDQLQEYLLHEELGGGWPTCPIHHTHPLEAAVDGATVVWCCPSEGRIATLGHLELQG